MNDTAPNKELQALMEEGLGHIAAGSQDQAAACFEGVVRGFTSTHDTDNSMLGQAHNQLGIIANNSERANIFLGRS